MPWDSGAQPSVMFANTLPVKEPYWVKTLVCPELRHGTSLGPQETVGAVRTSKVSERGSGGQVVTGHLMTMVL